MARTIDRSVLMSLALMVVLASSALAELDERTLIDLTYPFDEQTIYWPHNKPFAWEQTSWGSSPGDTGTPRRNSVLRSMEERISTLRFTLPRKG